MGTATPKKGSTKTTRRKPKPEDRGGAGAELNLFGDGRAVIHPGPRTRSRKVVDGEAVVPQPFVPTAATQEPKLYLKMQVPG